MFQTTSTSPTTLEAPCNPLTPFTNTNMAEKHESKSDVERALRRLMDVYYDYGPEYIAKILLENFHIKKYKKSENER